MTIFIACLLSYLIGSVPFALLIGKMFYGIDVREYGSHNLGATNTAGVIGVKAGLAVAVGDITKGIVAGWLPVWLHLDVTPLLIGMWAIVGHCFPIFAGFRGGKAAATTAGVMIAVHPWLFITGILTFVATIAVTKYVAIGTMAGGFSLFLYSVVSGDLLYTVVTGALAVFFVYLHRSNIRNLMQGTEVKVNDKHLKALKVYNPKGMDKTG